MSPYTYTRGHKIEWEEEAEDLMTALWDAGVRPRSGEGHTSHIRALNNHLEDMRKIAFHKLNIK